MHATSHFFSVQMGIPIAHLSSRKKKCEKIEVETMMKKKSMTLSVMSQLLLTYNLTHVAEQIAYGETILPRKQREDIVHIVLNK